MHFRVADRPLLAESRDFPGRSSSGGYPKELTFASDVSAKTSLTDRFTFNCGPSLGSVRIGGC